ncbi:aminoacyl-histidine dipeptidase [Marinomonas ostreistagni]|uniref:aminoacyl-histidine dipeptidase n=1 Tax=Marinomonas ostreistagni TaxID=359209 RepID=UPI00195157D0|nr:aminoacyl-histidine dipeptidase [Marinomonas ostreistagni]MBM6549947.1 aminoacyl-histidine dipeptidase [Marinomonas ostreistagni]
MNTWLESLTPVAIWRHFRLLCDTPRPSYHEQALRQRLQDWAHELGLEAFVCSAGNLIIKKPATPGMEDRATTVLQGHLDMVAQQEAQVQHDFLTDPIETYERDGWVHARGTTLGADNGIGVAAILAVLEADDLAHGPLEALFTIEEETSLRGAAQLEPGLLQGKRLLNLDSEDRGDVYIGCAGGIDINAQAEFLQQPIDTDHKALKISIEGLTGGHSGLDIHKGRANANVLLVRLLATMAQSITFGLCELKGGTLRNAIARDAYAVISFAAQEEAAVIGVLDHHRRLFQHEFKDTDPGLDITVQDTSLVPSLPPLEQASLLNTLLSLPNGVLRMSPTLADVTETSCNFGVVELVAEDQHLHFSVCLLARSLVDSQTHYMAQRVQAPLTMLGCTVALENAYPGWQPEPEAGLLQQFKQVHKDVLGTAPNVKVIHAGLECGIIGAKYPGMEMVSFGPNIRGAHSPSERLEIASVSDFWSLLVALLAATPKA